jgi:hypothetical protein
MPLFIAPDDVRLVKVPTLVMDGWAALVTDAAVATVPTTAPPLKFVSALPSPLNAVARTVPTT